MTTKLQASSFFRPQQISRATYTTMIDPNYLQLMQKDNTFNFKLNKLTGALNLSIGVVDEGLKINKDQVGH